MWVVPVKLILTHPPQLVKYFMVGLDGLNAWVDYSVNLGGWKVKITIYVKNFTH